MYTAVFRLRLKHIFTRRLLSFNVLMDLAVVFVTSVSVIPDCLMAIRY